MIFFKAVSRTSIGIAHGPAHNSHPVVLPLPLDDGRQTLYDIGIVPTPVQFMAGAMLSFGGLLSEVIQGGAAGLNANNPGIVKVLGGFVFPVGLVMYVFNSRISLHGELLHDHPCIYLSTTLHQSFRYHDLWSSKNPILCSRRSASTWHGVVSTHPADADIGREIFYSFYNWNGSILSSVDKY